MSDGEAVPLYSITFQELSATDEIELVECILHIRCKGMSEAIDLGKKFLKTTSDPISVFEVDEEASE